ncbi:FxSxx-COOH system tetratricopeptide repeat protein [Rhizocola hellebori]|uniref:FxSxx-COOH system tetratricopeptide repeat protein n=1 Tax=Rhizocola hellebori TaxID=1392758 RepID=UPI001942AC54|nr:FxSxx-COOH system tetratricopeptide repeat protein [Rhizocola hellebori]
MLRWLMVLALAVTLSTLTFLVGQWLMPPLLLWAGAHAGFRGGADLVGAARAFGPLGIASLTATAAVAAGRAWASRAIAVESGASAARERLVFGVIPPVAWYFQPRPNEQIALRRALTTGGAALVALPGMRGVGKSQIAAAYARECIKSGFGLVAWINAESGPTADLVRLLEVLGLGPAHEDQLTHEALVHRVRSVLERHDGLQRLIVFDNVEDPEDVREYLPTTGTTKTIITSNHREFVSMPGITAIPVDTFTHQQGRSFLAAATGYPHGADADEIGREMGWLPLGLAQAAAYITHNGLTCRQYLDALAEHDLDETLMQQKGADHPGVLRATAMTLARLPQEDSSGFTNKLLVVLSIMSPDGVKRELLTGSAAQSAFGADGTAIARALRILASCSLIAIAASVSLGRAGQTGTDTATVTMHRLIARVVRHRAGQSDSTALVEARQQVHRLLAAARPPEVIVIDDWRSLPIFRTLWPHLDSCAALNSSDRNVRQLFVDLARYQWLVGDYVPARSRCELTIRAWTDWLESGADIPDRKDLREQVLAMRFNLANIVRGLGDLAGARSIDEAVLAEQRVLLGPAHPHTLLSAGGLAADLRGLGHYRQALSHDTETYATWLDQFGRSHRRTLTAQSNLAVNYRLLGDFRAARRFDAQAFQLWRAFYGPDDAMFSAANLARDVRDAGAYRQSVRLLREVHRNVASRAEGRPWRESEVLWSLAVSLRLAGDVHEAVRLLELALSGFESKLGAESHQAAACRLSLAVGWLAMGDRRATPELQALLTRYTTKLGAKHPLTLACLSNLAVAEYLFNIGEPESSAQSAAAALSEVLGPEHPHAIAACNNQAVVQATTGHEIGARRRLAEATARAQLKLGTDHPDALSCRANLLLAEKLSGRSEADRELAEVTEELGRRLGTSHPVVLKLRKNEYLCQTIDPHSY